LSSEFDPAKYHDEHREKVLALIEAKADGEVVAPSSAPSHEAPVIDLMAALAIQKARDKGLYQG
jgi:DNA end-binding protein Ku